MKNTQKLSIFLIFCILSSILCSKSHMHSKSKMHAKSHSHAKSHMHSKNKLTTNVDSIFKGYFYVQRFYPGNDAIDSINESEFHTSLMFFVVNKDAMYYTKSVRRIQDIEGN